MRDEIPRDSRGNRLFRCERCGEWRRIEGRAEVGIAPVEGRCRLCARAVGTLPTGKTTSGERASAIEEVGRRIEAVRRLKVAARGRPLRDEEIDEACGEGR